MTRYGVLLPTFDPLRAGGAWPVAQAARTAEDLGFDAVWTGDHLACPAPGLDAPSCLAAAAAVTVRVSLGFSVMLLALRSPAWAAKQLTTIDALSGGRLVLGVGVGGEFPEEFTAAGVPVAERGRRVDETLSVLPSLLTGRPVKHDGRVLSLDVPALEPAMARPPPIFLGGRSQRAMRRPVRFGGAGDGVRRGGARRRPRRGPPRRRRERVPVHGAGQRPDRSVRAPGRCPRA